jgi:hypothetical protein
MVLLIAGRNATVTATNIQGLALLAPAPEEGIFRRLF